MKKQKNPIHGFINLHKPFGITSADAVNKVKWLLKPTKIGHAGTLDPLATGVLPLALGEGTKCVNLLMDAKKIYEFSVTFGERRSTDDAEGEVVATSDTIPTAAEIQSILPRFTGPISQIPPIYSALKVDGQRAYDLARAGEEVELKAREVTVYDLEFLGFNGATGAPLPAGEAGLLNEPKASFSNPGEGASEQVRASHRPHPDLQPIASGAWANPTSPAGRGSPAAPLQAHFRARVSKGTYIRSLGRDIAQALGSEGYISRLHRAAVGPFSDANAISLDFIEESVHKAPPNAGTPAFITPLHAALDDIPALALNGGQVATLRHGQQVSLADPHPDTPLMAALHQGELVGLVRVEGNRVISVRLLNL